MVAHHHCNRAISGQRDRRSRFGLHIRAAANGMILASQDIAPVPDGLLGDGRAMNGKSFLLDDCAGSLLWQVHVKHWHLPFHEFVVHRDGKRTFFAPLAVEHAMRWQLCTGCRNLVRLASQYCRDATRRMRLRAKFGHDMQLFLLKRLASTKANPKELAVKMTYQTGLASRYIRFGNWRAACCPPNVRSPFLQEIWIVSRLFQDSLDRAVVELNAFFGGRAKKRD